MSVGLLSLIVLVAAVLGFMAGRQRSLGAAGGDARKLHSLPQYHGQSVLLFTAVPAFLLMAGWLIVEPILVENRISGALLEGDAADPAAKRLLMADVRRVAGGIDTALEQRKISRDDLAALSTETTDVRALLGSVGVALGADVKPEVFQAAKDYRVMTRTGSARHDGRGPGVSPLSGFAFSYRRITQDFARPQRLRALA